MQATRRRLSKKRIHAESSRCLSIHQSRKYLLFTGSTSPPKFSPSCIKSSNMQTSSLTKKCICSLLPSTSTSTTHLFNKKTKLMHFSLSSLAEHIKFRLGCAGQVGLACLYHQYHHNAITDRREEEKKKTKSIPITSSLVK